MQQINELIRKANTPEVRIRVSNEVETTHAPREEEIPDETEVVPESKQQKNQL